MKITRGKIMNKLVKIYVELNSIIKNFNATTVPSLCNEETGYRNTNYIDINRIFTHSGITRTS